MNLTKHFYHSIKACTSLEDKQIAYLWQRLLNRYNESHRHYHTLTHIEAMIDYLEQYKTSIRQPMAVALAIYYHDVIYEQDKTGLIQKSNEQKSVEFFINEFSNNLDNQLSERVTELILLTEKHMLTNHVDTDAKWFLDIDLSILGQSKQVYQHYANAIRQEYDYVSDVDYRQGRQEVLEKFLQRPRLYFTDCFYQRYEAKARINIENERYHLITL